MIIIISIYVDGGVKDGYMYIGILCNSIDFPIKFSKKLELGMAHTAEENALFQCIKILTTPPIKEEIIIYCDQKYLVNVINATTITTKAIKTFPKSQKIKNFITQNKITLKWIKGKDNIAHTLIAPAYTGKIYNDVNINLPKTNAVSPVDLLKKELQKKDILIEELMNIITRLNKIS